MNSLVIASLIGLLFVIPQVQMIFAQKSGLDYMITQMRMTHSQLASNLDQVKQLVESNKTSEALGLLDGMDIEITQMNNMFNDLVWEASNKGH
jgi:UPF0716 family protein affecting phage T7 exclusion